MHLGNKLKGGKINIKYNLSRKLFLCSSYCFNVHMSCGKIFQNTDDKKKNVAFARSMCAETNALLDESFFAVAL